MIFPRFGLDGWRVKAALALAVLLLLIPVPGYIVGCLGGAWKYEPEELDERLSPVARALVDGAFAGLSEVGAVDHHCHVIGLDTNDSGTWVNPELVHGFHLERRATGAVYMSAAGIDDEEDADRQYVDRLVRLARAFGHSTRIHLLAFDHYHRPDGTVDLERSEFHVPNSYVFELAERNPELFVPVISVHPYREDALEELDQWGAKLAAWPGTPTPLVKWLPPAQGIDPSDDRIDPYYALMKKHGLVLLTHTGEEQAVEAEEDQGLANPLLFRRPLDLGVPVIMAHSASLGTDVDLDDPARPRVPSHELFLRMMDHACYEGLLYGELSAMIQRNRIPEPLVTLLARDDLHARLVNGSDYPLPAVNVVISVGALESEGLLVDADVPLLREIYDVNPLLFDLVVKRRLRHPESGRRFPPEVFGPLQRTDPKPRDPDCRRHVVPRPR